MKKLYTHLLPVQSVLETEKCIIRMIHYQLLHIPVHHRDATFHPDDIQQYTAIWFIIWTTYCMQRISFKFIQYNTILLGLSKIAEFSVFDSVDMENEYRP